MDGFSLSGLMMKVAAAFAWPIHEFLNDGRSRFFWFYIITGLLISWVVARRAKARQGDWRRMFAREVWLSASARNDYLLLVFRPLVALTLLSWAVVNADWIAGNVAAGLRAIGVSGTATDSMAVALGLLMTLVLFVVDDFLKWVAHTTFHRVPALWEFHKVHHSAEHLNFATAERIHPVELMATAALVTLGVGTVNGVFIAIAGDKLTPATLAGANVCLFTINIFGGVLRHSPFWLTFGPTVEKWIISPAQHQIHHSENPRHFDRNMGVSLAIWDRMAGTLCLAEKETVTAFGIGEETRAYRSFWTLIFRPFTASFAITRRAIAAAFARNTGRHASASQSRQAS